MNRTEQTQIVEVLSKAIKTLDTCNIEYINSLPATLKELSKRIYSDLHTLKHHVANQPIMLGEITDEELAAGRLCKAVDPDPLETDENIFDYETSPKEVQDVIDRFDEASYETCAECCKQLEAIGYEATYSLSAEITHLRKIK